MYIKIRTKSLVFSHIRDRKLCSTTRNIGQGKSILNTFPLVFLVKIVCKYTFQCRKCVSWTKLHHVIASEGKIDKTEHCAHRPRWRHLGDMRTTEHAIDGRP